MTVPCVPNDPVANQILQSCAANFAANNDDCNRFLKAALLQFLETGYLDGLNADAIVGKLRAGGSGWTATRSIGNAISQAKTGNIVVAGMTSADLHDSHGHVAVVVGCDGQVSGDTIVPMGYAGSLSAAGRLEGGRLSGTFAASLVRSEGLDYYIRPPDRTPA
jgi:hypothetical protein